MVFVKAFRIAFENKIAEFILLKETKVVVVPELKLCNSDGVEGYIRMSFATSEKKITDALGRIKNQLI
jgi:aspartate/methionine/tyrosine aminotransferase